MNKNLVSDKIGRITTLEQLFEVSNLDPKEREIIKAKVNVYNQAQNKKDGSTELIELFQIWCEVKPINGLFEPNVKDMLFDVFKEHIPKLEGPAEKDGDNMATILHFDLHIDRLEHKNKNYLSEINNRTMKLFERLLKYNPQKLMYVNGGDYFNSNGFGSKTARGTQQFNYLSESESFKLGLQHQLELIKTFASELPVEAVYLQANHDPDKLQQLSDALELYFSNTNNVKIDNEAIIRKYKYYGDNLIALLHGHEINNKQLPNTVISEAKQKKNMYVLLGHKHTRVKQDLGKILIDTFPSPSYPSAREQGIGHSGRGGIYGQMYHKKKGRIAEYKE